MQYEGYSQRRMVAELNRLGIPTLRGGRWHLATLQALVKRIEALRVRDALPALLMSNMASPTATELISHMTDMTQAAFAT